MDNFFSSGGFLPLWILGAPFILMLIEYLRSPGPSRRERDTRRDEWPQDRPRREAEPFVATEVR